MLVVGGYSITVCSRPAKIGHDALLDPPFIGCPLPFGGAVEQKTYKVKSDRLGPSQRGPVAVALLCDMTLCGMLLASTKAYWSIPLL